MITREQVLAAGVGRGAISHRLLEGWLQRLHRGVYLIGGAAPTPAARARAAVLACGEGAVLSHRSAAERWGLLASGDGKGASGDADVEVTVCGRNPGKRPGIRIHRVSALDRTEITLLHGLPITTPARTICDLAGVAASHETERALAEARIRRLVSETQLRSVTERAPTRAGSALIRSLLRQETGPAFTRSEAERRLLALLREAQLPDPVANSRVCGYEVDFLWPAQRLVVEVDGHPFHAHRTAFERDRRRDQALVAAGYRVIRVTWRQLVDEPLAVIARIAQAIARDAA